MRTSDLVENSGVAGLDWLIVTDASFNADSTKRALVNTVYEGAKSYKNQYYSGSDLAAKVAALGSTPCMVITDTSQTISVDLTIPGTMAFDTIPGVILTIATGVTVTMPIPDHIGSRQIFSCMGSGKVVFTSSPGKIKSSWFGLDVAALQAAISSAPSGSTIVMSRNSTYYSCSSSITVGIYGKITLEFEPGFENRMAVPDVDMFSISTDDVRMIGNQAILRGYGTYVATGTSGKSLIRSTGDRTFVENFYLQEPETSAIRMEGDYNEIYDNLIEGGPFYADSAAIGSNRFHLGILLYGAIVSDENPYGSSHNKVKGNRVIANSSGGKVIEAIFGGHMTHPSMDNEIVGNKFYACWDHSVYLLAEGTRVIGNNIRNGGIKMQMRPSGTAERGNIVAFNIGDNTGMESGPLKGDAFLTFGNCEWTIIAFNEGTNYQNAGIQFSGTDSPYVIRYIKAFGNIINGVIDGNSTWACGLAVNDSNLATFAHNDFYKNTFKIIGDDVEGYQAGIAIISIANTDTHVDNSFDDNKIDTVQENAMYMQRLTGGSISRNQIYNIGVGTPSAAIEMVDMRDFDVSYNKAEGTLGQQTCGYNEDTDSRRNRITNNTFKNCATAPIGSLSASSYAANNSIGSDNGEILSYSTAGDRTITAADLIMKTHLRDPNGAARVDTLDTAANIISMLLPNVGANHEIMYINRGEAAETITLAGGTGVTIFNNEGSSDAVIPAGSAATIKLYRVTSSVVHAYVTVFEAV